MRIDGQWLLSDDGVLRPIIRARVKNRDGQFEPITFLVDSGADVTVLCDADFQRLGLDAAHLGVVLDGLGAQIDAPVVETRIQFPEASGLIVAFRGQYSVCPNQQFLDISLLGRDITNQFAMIIDRPGDEVCLINQPHRYAIIAN